MLQEQVSTKCGIRKETMSYLLDKHKPVSAYDTPVKTIFYILVNQLFRRA